MNQPIKLPVLPLRNMVFFPGVTTQVIAGRRQSVAAIRAALQADQRVFVTAQREELDQVEIDNLYAVGTIAEISQVQEENEAIQLVIRGIERGTAVRFELNEGAIVAATLKSEEIAPERPDQPLFLALQKEVEEKAVELGRRSGLPLSVLRQALSSVSDLGQLSDLIASYLDLPVNEKQELLEELEVERRLRNLLLQLNRRLAVLEAQQDIQSKVQEELGERQRQALLREQLKAIRKELGEGDTGEEIDDLRRALEELDLPEEVRSEVERDLNRLSTMGRDATEAQVLRSYLETVVELPWNKRSQEKYDLTEARKTLEEDHYGLSDVKDRVLEHLAVLKLKRGQVGEGASNEERSRSPILLFSGPPGVGKTSIAKSIARSLGREYVRISLGGVRDEADIRGHRRTYVGALPGRIIQGLRQAGTCNPVFLLDEIDKLGVSLQGDPASALLEVLDPAQNNSFEDHYLGLPFDLSEVLFVATSNYIQNIPAPLLDRMELIEFQGYTESEKVEIAKRYLWPRQKERNGLGSIEVDPAPEALRSVISSYTREAGVRQLERELGRVARKTAVRVASGERPSAKLQLEDIRAFLGKKKAYPERAARSDRVGVATGMFYTPVGGDILFVEATTMKGSGNLTLTGQLGDVMKESAQAAWSYARANAVDFLIDERQFERDVHVHVPAGAIPKDGPSAGITLATALISTLSRIPVRHDIAMTGEITLTGRVLQIGGVKEKVLGGVRAGIRTFILPEDNAEDLEDLPKEVLQSIEVHFVKTLGEVLEIALRGGVFRSDSLVAES